MRSTPVVALAVLLACLPARAVEVIDLHATAQSPEPSSSVVLAHAPALLSAHLPLPFDSPLYLSPYFPQYFTPLPPAQWPGYLPAEWADMPSTSLSTLPMSSTALPPAVLGAGPMPVPEPVSVLMLACGLLLMVPGAWAARWSRLGDSESFMPRRLP